MAPLGWRRRVEVLLAFLWPSWNPSVHPGLVYMMGFCPPVFLCKHRWIELLLGVTFLQTAKHEQLVVNTDVEKLLTSQLPGSSRSGIARRAEQPVIQRECLLEVIDAN